MVFKPAKDRKTLVRVPLLVVPGNGRVRPERVELLMGDFLYINFYA
jgi:hypothetical protein